MGSSFSDLDGELCLFSFPPRHPSSFGRGMYGAKGRVEDEYEFEVTTEFI
jgi:hypothetical protein